MQKAQIRESSLHFLQLLKNNNNRDWFAAHKDLYTAAQDNIVLFADALLAELGSHDLVDTPSGKKSLHRIYRDTRFSADKTPYKTNWSGNFSRATKSRRGGYYFHIQPGNSYIAGGFWGPSPPDIKRIRDEIAFDPAPLRKILKSKSFVSTFGELRGEQLKTAPRSFDNQHEAIGLLRYKQYLLIRTFSNKEVLDTSFVKQASQTFKNMRPFFDYMSEVLTTDVNGIAI
ncbi:MAG TPA: DUF2461 domain-containing protein [Chitinophagaceae bacterium]|jgi:uncharacterized protein (TIGR02453 family)